MAKPKKKSTSKSSKSKKSASKKTNSKKSNSLLWILVLGAIFSLGFIIHLSSGCDGCDGCDADRTDTIPPPPPPPPPPPVVKEKVKLVYYYNHSNQFMSEANNMQSSLKNGVKLLNRLSDLLEINKEFEIIGYRDVNFNTHNKNRLARIREYKRSDTIRIFIDTSGFKFKLPHYDYNLDFISLKYKERYDPVVLMHEISHKITNNSIPHTITNEITPSCIISNNAGCKNLMSSVDVYPFNFLITESQKDWIKNKTYNSNCSEEHIYPEIVINNRHQKEIGCCSSEDIVPESRIRQILREVHGDRIPEDYINKILKEIEVLKSKKICPTTMGIKHYEELIKVIEKKKTITTNDGDVLHLSVQGVYELNYNIFADISLIFKKSLNHFTKDHYDDEARILTKGTGVNIEDFSFMRRTNSAAKLKARQEEIDSGRSPILI